MKIKSIIKTAALTSLLTTSCSNQKVYNTLHEAKAEKTMTMVLDSLASQGRALVDNCCKQYGRDTIMISKKDIKNPQLLAKKLQNIASNKNPYIIKPAYRKSCDCTDSQKLFTQTHAVINPKKVYQNEKSEVYYVPVEFFGKK